MGNPKQKWTSEEEDALRNGVKKHGTGKWKDIQKDPEFNPILSSRSNIDLKDKWRNMTVSGLGPREKPRLPKTKANPDSPAAPLSIPQTSTAATPVKLEAPTVTPVRRDAPAASPVGRNATSVGIPVRRDAPAAAPPVRCDAPATPVTDDSSTVAADAISAQMYNEMIFEALKSSTEPNGMDAGAIASFIEQRNELPQNFKRVLSNRLRRLVQQDKLEKIQNCYRRKTDSSCGTKAPAPKPKDIQPRQLQSPDYMTSGDTIEESAVAAACWIAEAENKSFVAAEAMKEADRISQMADDNESLLQLANEILQQVRNVESGVLMRA